MKTLKGVEVFLISALVEDELSVTQSGRFTPDLKVACTHPASQPT
jgi:hypothetical protein